MEGEDGRASNWDVTIGVLAGLGVLVVVAYGSVWLGSWSIPPDRYANERQWWAHYALPRAGWSLLVGVPVGIAAGLLVVHLIRRSRTGTAAPVESR